MAYVPDDALDRFSELTTGEERLYIRLCRFVSRDEQDKNYGLAWPARATLATMLDCTESHISDLITSLCKKQWVAKIGWKFRLLVGDFRLNSGIIPTIQPRKSRKIPTKSETADMQLSESEVANSRNPTSQLSESEPLVRKNQHEPRVEPEREPEESARAEKTRKPKSPKKPALSDDEWLGSLEANPIYHGIDIRRLNAKMIVWCETNNKQPTRRRLVNWLNREEKPIGTNGVNGNGSSKQSGFDESSRENARRLTATYDYYGERVEAAREALRVARTNRNGNSDTEIVERSTEISVAYSGTGK